jgi:hypothetical protein
MPRTKDQKEMSGSIFNITLGGGGMKGLLNCI